MEFTIEVIPCNNLAIFIKSRREELRLTQRMLGDKLGVTTQFISNLERSVSPLPVDKILKLVVALGADLDMVLDLMVKDYAFNLKTSFKKLNTPEALYGPV